VQRLQDKDGALVAIWEPAAAASPISVAHSLPQAVVYATDVSDEALDLARKNARINHVEKRIEWVHGGRINGQSRY
jgi:methylase of polypeptide subunit release factors